MQKLIDGIHRFRSKEFGRYRELFGRLAQEGQRPEALFITCADSRVVAELITHSRPGDLFVIKNVGNIVPPADPTLGPNSTGAAVEFAVETLQVRDIIVCGHSQCGAMDALMNGLPCKEKMPHLCSWLELAKPVRRTIDENYVHITDPSERVTAAAQENVLFSVETLLSYPSVRERIEAGALQLHAWFFKIATAELFAYDPDQKQFAPLVDTDRYAKKK